MEHPHNLLKLVVQQHYSHRLQVLETANNIIREYSESKITYEQTLSNLYQLLNDLPSDIILYYLSTVPLPDNQEVKSNSVLPGLMKQMLIPSYHNGMRPVLLKYLNEKIPPLIPIVPETNETENSEMGSTQSFSSQSSEDNSENKENVRSVIDDNILRQDKNKNKKTTKPKTRSYATRNSNVKPLTLLCGNNIYKNHHSYFSRYRKQRREAWRLVHSNKCNKNELDLCYTVIRDINKKIKWLGMIKTGQVTKDIIEEEYSKSNVFYLERHLQNTVSEDILDLNSKVTNSINLFLSKC